MWPHVCTQQHTCSTQHVQWDKRGSGARHEMMYYTASVCLHPQTARLVPGHVYLEWGCKEKGVHYPSINTLIHTTSLNGIETNH